MQIRQTLLLTLLVITSISLARPVRAQLGQEPFELIRSSEEEAVFRVTIPDPEFRPAAESGDVSVSIPGWGDGGEVGGPQLPGRSVFLGIPDGAEPIVEVVSVRTRFEAGRIPQPVPTMEIEDDADGMPFQSTLWLRNRDLYAESTPDQWAGLERTARLRHLPIAVIEIRPIRWDPDRQGLLIAEEMEIRVRFPRPSGLRGESTTPRPPRDPEIWERRYERTVLNWEQASKFVSLAPRPAVQSRSAARGSGPEFRIDVTRTDLYRVPYETLVQSGWDLGAVNVNRIVLEERFWDEVDAVENSEPVPVWVRDYDTNGEFGPGDELVFYGLTSFDRLDPEPWDKRWGRRNSYWLTVRDEGGVHMATSPSTLGLDGLTSIPSYSWTQHIEEDVNFMRIAANGEDSFPIAGSVENLVGDHYSWFGGDGRVSVNFDLPGYVSAEGLEVGVQDVYIEALRRQPIFDIEVGVTEQVAIVFEDLTVSREKSFQVFEFDAADLAGVQLAERGNDFIIDQPAPTAGGYVDYFRWTYQRRSRALNDQIDFDTDGLTGPRQWDLSGFQGTDIVLVDVTDPRAPIRLPITAGQVTGTGSNRSARIQIDLGQSGVERSYAVRWTDTMALPEAVERASGEDLSLPRSSDVVVIAHPDFIDGMGPWVDHRTSQGWDVELVSVRDVFDQFNGGRAWAPAIRNFLRYTFRTRETPPSFVLLVGDGSNDHAQVLPRSAPDYVPTQTLFSNAHSNQGPELVAVDHYFVDDLVGTGNTLDLFADAHIGRLPVGNQSGEGEQLGNLIDKIIRYDDLEPTDVWRNRGLFAADDDFSSKVNNDGDYKFRGDSFRQWPRTGESIFRYGAREAERRIRRAGFLDFAVDSLYLASYLDTVACLRRCIPVEDPLPPDCVDWSCAVDAGGEIVDIQSAAVSGMFNDTVEYATNVARIPEAFREKIKRGNLFVVIQAHANRAQATHELLWVESDVVGRNDSERLENVGRPFLFFGFGCHMADYSHHEENSFTRGDSMTERMLFQDEGRGAVAGVASTGYEWLPENDRPLIPLMEAWFEDPPTGPDGRTRWLLGEMIDAGKLLSLMQEPNNVDPKGMILTYPLLGDPTMTIDLAPPRVDLVEVDGEPWSEDRALRTAVGSDEVTIEVRFRDEVALENIAVLSGGVEIDSRQYEILPDPDFPELDGRAVVRYVPTLDVPVEDYEIVIRADDLAGRRREMAFPVELETQFELLRAGEFVPLTAGSVVALEDSVRVTFSSPVVVSADEITFWSAGFPQQILALTPSEAGAQEDWSWTLVTQITSQVPEAFDLTLQVERRDQSVARRSVSVTPVGERASLIYLANMPNPFADETHFVYRLDGPVASVDLSIFTLAGRKIWEAEGPVQPTENYIVWDGRDRDGDEVANGVYFYKVLIRTLQGEEISRIERIARVR